MRYETEEHLFLALPYGAAVVHKPTGQVHYFRPGREAEQACDAASAGDAYFSQFFPQEGR